MGLIEMPPVRGEIPHPFGQMGGGPLKGLIWQPLRMGNTGMPGRKGWIDQT